jgi:hypothetical protein
MSTTRPLSTVISPTENALRALLVKTLSGTAISSYEAWVTLNSAGNAATAGPEAPSWRATVADGLVKPRAFVDEVAAGLLEAGLMEGSGALATRGELELAAAAPRSARHAHRVTCPRRSRRR